ncbi:MAG TPA: hypothetical protein VN132_02130 [Bdellovibrio sp.]|nr:hypothetical protein [Bdellovibrio sp.]
MKVGSLLAFALFSLSALSSFADETSFCPDRLERRESIQVQQMVSADKTICYISIHNFRTKNLVYRDYIFTSDGGLMVFNSFGEGPDSQSTGAREYYMFPRPNKNPTFTWQDESHTLQVIDATGGSYLFDYESEQLVGMSLGTSKVASDVSEKNNGGVEISKFKGILLDAGFTKGHAPSQISSGTSVLKDFAGRSCKVRNKDLFKYTADGDAIFKYSSDEEFKKFLKSKCPLLE